MIPPKIIKFLREHGNLGMAGLRDTNLAPFGSRVGGWTVTDDGRKMTAFIPERHSERVLAALQENGQVAITVEEFPLHETYQFKGRYLSHRPIQASEVEIVNRLRERFANGVRGLVTDEEPIDQLRASIPKPGFAVDVEVHEVFVQTPGPNAGARIAPAAES